MIDYVKAINGQRETYEVGNEFVVEGIMSWANILHTCQLLRITNQYLKYDGAKRPSGDFLHFFFDRDFLHFQHVKLAFPCTV